MFAAAPANLLALQKSNHVSEACAAIMQIGSRAERMGLASNDSIFLYSATRLQDILAEIISMRPRAVIIDSIQTVYLDDVNGSAGSVSQVPLLPLLSLPVIVCL